MKAFFFVSLILAFTNTEVKAGTFLVMSSEAAPKVEKMSFDSLKKIFLGRKIFWSNGQRIYPSLSNFNDPGVKNFLSDVMTMSLNRYLKYWRRRMFAGKGHPPIEHLTDAETLAYVKKHHGAIGIISQPPANISLSGVAVFAPSKREQIINRMK